jgi:hypothetical protein
VPTSFSLAGYSIHQTDGFVLHLEASGEKRQVKCRLSNRKRSASLPEALLLANFSDYKGHGTDHVTVEIED